MPTPENRPIHRRQNTSEGAELDPARASLVLFAGAAVLAVAAWIVLADAVGTEHLAGVMHRVEPVWLAACFGAQMVAYLGYVLAVRNVARVDGGPRLSLSLTTRTVVAGFGVYAATHASGGFAVDYWTLRRAGLRREQAVPRVLGLGALEYAVLASATLGSAVLLLLGEGGHVQDAMTLPWLLVIPGFAAAAWVSSPRRAPRLADPGRGGRVRHGFAHAVTSLVTLRALAASPGRHAPAFLGVALYWAGDIACLWAALRMVSAAPPVPALVVAYAGAYVLSRRSLPAGGAGVVEVLMTLALVGVGVPLAPAVLAVLFYRLFNFWLPILPALAALPTVRELQRAFAEAERAAA